MQCAAEVIPGESNPVRSSRSPGGVAVNIARALSDLDCIVGLASRVGSDPGGRALVDYLATSRIKAVDITEETTCHTAAYTAVVDPQGELVVGLADMEIYNRLPDDIRHKMFRHFKHPNAVSIQTIPKDIDISIDQNYYYKYKLGEILAQLLLNRSTNIDLVRKNLNFAIVEWLLKLHKFF